MTEQPQPEGAAALGGAAPRGLRDAKAVGRALQSMGYEGGGGGGEDDLWAGFGGQVAPVKPHKAADGAWTALRAAAQVRVGGCLCSGWGGQVGLSQPCCQQQHVNRVGETEDPRWPEGPAWALLPPSSCVPAGRGPADGAALHARAPAGGR